MNRKRKTKMLTTDRWLSGDGGISVKTKGVLEKVATSDGRRLLSPFLSVGAARCGLSGLVELNESFSLDGAT